MICCDEFRVPVHLGDLELSGTWVSRDAAAKGVPKGNFQRLALDGVDEELAGSVVEAMVGGTAFEVLYCFVRDAANVSEALRTRVAESLCGALENVAEAPAVRKGGVPDDDARTQRNAFVMTAYLCHAALLAAEANVESSSKKKKKVKRKDDEDSEESSDDDDEEEPQRRQVAWARARDVLGRRFARTLEEVDVATLWSFGTIGDEFLLLWTRVGARLGVMEALLAAVQAAPANVGFGTANAAALVEEIGTSDAVVADFCAVAPAETTGDVLREIQRISLDDNAKAMAKFLDALATKAPGACAKQLPALRELLATAPYAVRSAVTALLAAVLSSDAEKRRVSKRGGGGGSQEDDERILDDANRDDALALLFSRRLDLNHYARAAAVRSIALVVQKGAVPLALITGVVDAVANRLKDKAALVRRAALKCLVALIEHNPYRADLAPDSFRDTITAWEKEMSEEEKEEPVEVRISRDAVGFVERLEAAGDEIAKLLDSETAGDATGAAEFFVLARTFNLPCGDAGLRRALRLVWSPDDGVRRKIVALLAKAIADPDNNGPRAADKFRNLVDGCSDTDIACLEDLALSCASPDHDSSTKKKTTAAATKKSKKKDDEDDDDDDDVVLPHQALGGPKLVRALWAMTTDPVKARGAVRALAILATAEGPAVVDTTALSTLISRVGPQNLDLAAAVATLLRDASSTEGDMAEFRQKAGQAARAVRDALALAVVGPGDINWYTAADAVILATFAFDAAPESAAARFLSHLGLAAQHDRSGVALARLLHAGGHVALQLTAAAEELGKILKKQTDAEMTAEKKDDDELEAGLGVGAEGRDFENETRLAEIVEKDILGGEMNQLAVLAPLAAKVVEKGLQLQESTLSSSDRELLRAATLALAKYSCVSRKFCEAHLALLVTTLVSGNVDVAARVNVAVALGDLAARQPNSVEPWTDHVYSALNDADVRVRGNVLAAVARLAHNDLVKLKGAGVADLAKRIVDDDHEIRAAAHAFFADLHRKTTAKHSPVYNLLPDVVSRLAHGDPSTFEDVIAFLLGFVDKDKHIDLLAEKLVHRINALKAHDDPTTASRNLAFALSKLPIHESLVRKFHDFFPLYKDALLDDKTNACFLAILSKAQSLDKSPDSDFSDVLIDWATKLGVPPSSSRQSSASPRQSTSTNVGRKKSTKAPTTRRKAKASSGAIPTTAKRSQRRRPASSQDDDYDDDDDESLLDKENRASMLVDDD